MQAILLLSNSFGLSNMNLSLVTCPTSLWVSPLEKNKVQFQVNAFAETPKRRESCSRFLTSFRYTMAEFVTNIIHNSLSGFVSGAVTTVGGYAGDAVAGLGNMVENGGKALGDGMSDCIFA
jgi:hypothetical protein